MEPREESELFAALQALSERERDARDRLIQARDELNDRVERVAALEEELWLRFEEHELRARDEANRLREEANRLREEANRLREEANRLREEANRLREEADRLREEADRRREEAVRLRVRLDGIQASAPMRLYARFKHLPGLRGVAERRTSRYEAALQARLRGITPVCPYSAGVAVTSRTPSSRSRSATGSW
jgi:uncharacterized coiled-coil DUF342 family protein